MDVETRRKVFQDKVSEELKRGEELKRWETQLREAKRRFLTREVKDDLKRAGKGLKPKKKKKRWDGTVRLPEGASAHMAAIRLEGKK